MKKDLMMGGMDFDGDYVPEEEITDGPLKTFIDMTILIEKIEGRKA